MALVTEKDMTKKCLQCMEIIHQAKERQAAEANKHASILLQEIDQERSREETRKAAAARRREKKRQKKKEKQEQLRAKGGDSKENIGSSSSKKDSVSSKNNKQQKNLVANAHLNENNKKDAVNAKNNKQKNSITNSHTNENHNNDSSTDESSSSSDNDEDDSLIEDGESLDLLEIIHRDMLLAGSLSSKRPLAGTKQQVQSQQTAKLSNQSKTQAKPNQQLNQSQAINRQGQQNHQSSPHNQQNHQGQQPQQNQQQSSVKEIVRKSKKVIVPASAISRVIGRGGCNINAVREVSCAHIEVEKQKGQSDRGVIIKGTAEATRIATQLIYALINESNKDLNEVIKKLGLQRPAINATNNPCKYMSTNSSISSSSSSKSTYTNSSLKTNTIPSVGVWNNSTAANMVPSQASARTQRPTVHSPAIATNYSVPSSIATTSYLLTSAIKDPTVNTYLQHPLPAHNQTSPQQSQIKNPSGVSIDAIAQQIAAVGHRPQSQYDPDIQSQDLADYNLAFANVPVSTPEYNPFDNLFSKVAQTSVWQQNVSTSTAGQQDNSIYATNEAEDPLRHLPNLKPIGTERKTILECMNRMSMMNLPPYNQ